MKPRAPHERPPEPRRADKLVHSVFPPPESPQCITLPKIPAIVLPEDSGRSDRRPQRG